jgi:hypothetical protein
MKNQIQNNVFGQLDEMEIAKIPVAKAGCIRLWAWRTTKSQEIVPTAEALVAYDPATDTIVKFIAAFVPPPLDGSHKGIKYFISKDSTGGHHPVLFYWDDEQHTSKPKKEKNKKFWHKEFFTGYLDYGMLPMNCATAEFRLLRAYREGVRTPARFELISFQMPMPGELAEKDTFVLECTYNGVPPIQLSRCLGPVFRRQKEIIEELGYYAGMDLSSALGLGIKRKLETAVSKGVLPAAAVAEILHDHSEDPVEEGFSESMAATMGTTNMVRAEEGKDFYVPDNPLVKAAREEEEEAYPSYTPEAKEDEDYEVPENPLAKTEGQEEEEVVFFD